MKYLLFTLLALITFTHAASISTDPAFKSVFANKAAQNKLVLMIYSAKSCPQCAYMKQKVFTQKEVKAYLDAHFVVLEKDVNYDDLPDGFDYFGIPTIFFIDKKGSKIETFVGSSRAVPFLETLQKVVTMKKGS